MTGAFTLATEKSPPEAVGHRDWERPMRNTIVVIILLVVAIGAIAYFYVQTDQDMETTGSPPATTPSTPPATTPPATPPANN
jgi:hypothetical protein